MLRAASLAALSLLAAVVVACGGGAAAGDADPASAVPADAVGYLEATVRPEGGLRDDARAAAGKVLRTDDPDAKVRELIDRSLAESDAKIQFERDIKPWLGKRAGVWFSGRLDADGEPEVVIVAAVTDPEAALDAVRKGDRGLVTKRSYNGVDYEVDKDGFAAGIVDDFLAAGDEPAFKRTVDASKGDSLADSDRYRTGVDRLDDGRLAHLYLDLARVVRLSMQREPGGEEQLRQIETLVPLDRLGPLMASFSADADRLTVDARMDAKRSGALGALGSLSSGGGTPLLKELPGDAWGAFGAPKYGQSLKAAVDQYAGVLGGAAARQQLRSQFGIDLDEDILSWVGDVAVFVRGTSLTALDGGVVIQVTDEGKAAKGFGKLVGLLQVGSGLRAKPVKVDGAETAFAVAVPDTLSKPIVFARSASKVVVAYGTAAAAAALRPAAKLGDSETYQQAKDALDGEMEPSFLLSVPALARFLTDPDAAEVRPYLDAYDVIAAGWEGGANGGRARLAAGLK
jgi:hypothetical protein